MYKIGIVLFINTLTWLIPSLNGVELNLTEIYIKSLEKGKDIVLPEDLSVEILNITVEKDKLPETYDCLEKFPNCANVVVNGKAEHLCSGCWAFTVAAMISGRVCIKGLGTSAYSEQDILECARKDADGCKGGLVTDALKYWVESGVVTGGGYKSNEGCKPYADDAFEKGELTPGCKEECSNKEYKTPYKDDKSQGEKFYRVEAKDVDKIKQEILDRGPVVANMEVYEDFLTYTQGIYAKKNERLIGKHDVVIVGWGADHWKCVNYWGEAWGTKSRFNIVIGKNECGIENFVFGGTPKEGASDDEKKDEEEEKNEDDGAAPPGPDLQEKEDNVGFEDKFDKEWYIKALESGNVTSTESQTSLSEVEVVEHKGAMSIVAKFDVRMKWRYCASLVASVRGYGKCSASWAFAAAALMKIRHCIVSEGTGSFHYSEQDIIECTYNRDGCKGGFVVDAFRKWKEFGFVHYGCKLFEKETFEAVSTHQCRQQCTNSLYNLVYNNDRVQGSKFYMIKSKSVISIQQEIAINGPVVAHMQVHQDFFKYKDEIYYCSKTTTKYVSEQAVLLIGWGVSSGHKFWKAVAFFGKRWSSRGFFRIGFGTNECGIEEKVVGAEISTENANQVDLATLHAMHKSTLNRTINVILNFNMTIKIVHHKFVSQNQIPPKFDCREKWKKCVSLMNSLKVQRNCGASWAFAAAALLSIRHCIETNGQIVVEYSEEHFIECVYTNKRKPGGGCNGGLITDAFDYWLKNGVVTGGGFRSRKGCKPYSESSYRDGRAIKCELRCNNEHYSKPFEEDLMKGKYYYKIVNITIQIQYEITIRGPVIAHMQVYEDFLLHKEGVYQHKSGALISIQAVLITGWGIENGKKYWIATNFWGVEFIAGGYFKIAFGECMIEVHVFGVIIIGGQVTDTNSTQTPASPPPLPTSIEPSIPPPPPDKPDDDSIKNGTEFIIDPNDPSIPQKNHSESDFNETRKDHFDPKEKWPACEPVFDSCKCQGKCAAAWAFAVSGMVTSRECIKLSRTRTEYSVQDILECAAGAQGCKGGLITHALEYMRDTGVVSGGPFSSEQGCKPFEIEAYNRSTVPACRTECTNAGYPTPYPEDKSCVTGFYVLKPPPSVEAIKHEIMTAGPVIAHMQVYEDFLRNTGGIYQYKVGKLLGEQAVILTGWKTEDGVSYWTGRASFGRVCDSLGGEFKIVLGTNECGIEGKIFGVDPGPQCGDSTLTEIPQTVPTYVTSEPGTDDENNTEIPDTVSPRDVPHKPTPRSGAQCYSVKLLLVVMSSLIVMIHVNDH